MKRNVLKIGALLTFVPAVLLLDGCGGARADTRAAEAPPSAKIVPGFDVSVFSVQHPEQFPVATATAQATAPELVVTGTVNPDIARNVPVISLASGRVVSIHARLGDTVNKGQLLLTVRSDDISGAFGLLRKTGAFGKLLPWLDDGSHILAHTESGIGIYEHTLTCILNSPQRVSIRLAALFHQIAAPALDAADDVLNFITRRLIQQRNARTRARGVASGELDAGGR